MNAFTRTALLAVAVASVAQAPQAQEAIDQDVPGRLTVEAQAVDLRRADDVDDRDPGAPRVVARPAAEARIVSDLDADAITFAGPPTAPVVRASLAAALDDGRDPAPTPAQVSRIVARTSTDAPLDNGRDGRQPAEARAYLARSADAPLDNGRAESATRPAPVETAQDTPAFDAPGTATAPSERLRLDAVRPNPTGDRARVTFSTAEAGRATVAVYDVQGRAVMTVFEGPVAADREQTVTLDATSITPGVYLVVLTAEGVSASRVFQVVR